MHRPWAAGLSRLLAERRLKKGDLAELADVRPGTISAVANSPKSPDIATLQRLAQGLTRFDQKANPKALPVPLWEFFVNDEQAALLRQSASKQQEMASQDQLIDRVMERLAPLVTSALKDELTGTSTTPAATHNSATPPVPPAHVARGSLHRRQPKKTA